MHMKKLGLLCGFDVYSIHFLKLMLHLTGLFFKGNKFKLSY